MLPTRDFEDKRASLESLSVFPGKMKNITKTADDIESSGESNTLRDTQLNFCFHPRLFPALCFIYVNGTFLWCFGNQHNVEEKQKENLNKAGNKGDILI